jgi:pimeloyl-ACP methyl ester carboxylesterase
MMIEANGMELHYDVTGEGDPLLWLHGHMGHGPDWQYVFPESPAGYRVIAPDLRGHGRSTGAGPAYSFRQSAQDVFALLDSLAVNRVRIIGLSGGGITALHMATAQPDRVTAMVIVSAPPTFPDQARSIQRVFSEAMLGEGERALMRQRHRREGQFESLIAQANAFADSDDPGFTAAQLATITAETLVVFGDRDPLYPLSSALDLRYSVAKAWLWVVPNGGHGPVFGPSAPAFADTALGFFAGRFRS